jgi:hypothetical protein
MSVQKIPTNAATPLSAQGNNLLPFQVYGELPIDMRTSYVELELALKDGVDNYNVVCGANGLMYPATCFFRQARLDNRRTGETLQDLNFVNVWDANVKYWAKSANEVVADALWSGAGHLTPDNKIVSIFKNQYSDANPTIKVPLSSLFPGTLGASSVLPAGDDLSFNFLLEPMYSPLMRCVPASVYTSGSAYVDIESRWAANTNSTTITASALGVVGKYTAAQGITLFITYTDASTDIQNKTVASVNADTGSPGSIVVNSVLSATKTTASIEIVSFQGTNYKLQCGAIEETGKTLTLEDSTPAGEDLRQGTVCNIHLEGVDVDGNLISSVVQNTVKTLTGSPITAILFVNDITVPTEAVYSNVWIEPLYTNLGVDAWSILSAHIVVYRKNIKVKQSKMIASQFSSINTQCFAGLSKFMFNYKIDSNCHNVYVCQPTNTSLYSVAHKINNYLVSVDEKPLTSVYIPVDSSLDRDNFGRAIANSTTYKLKNLRKVRDEEIQTDIEAPPVVIAQKIFDSVHNGEENVQPMGIDKNLRLELNPGAGETTESATVYLFQETFKEIF